MEKSATEANFKLPVSKLRKYCESYIQFGFIENSDGRPKCVVCLQVLANEAMKPAKLKRHLVTRNPQYKDKTKDFFMVNHKKW